MDLDLLQALLNRVSSAKLRVAPFTTHAQPQEYVNHLVLCQCLICWGVFLKYIVCVPHLIVTVLQQLQEHGSIVTIPAGVVVDSQHSI